MSDDYYKLLGIQRNADENEIKKAFRKLSLKYHPDKVPSAQKAEAEKMFKEINEAVGVLSNPEKRKIYDKHGKKGLEEFERMGGSRGGGNPFAGMGGFPFANMAGMGGMGGFPFGNMGGMGGERLPALAHVVHLDLDAFYHGKAIAFNVNIKEKCVPCSATGTSDTSKKQKCSSCNGAGQVTIQRMMGPGMMMQQTVVCPGCQGRKESIPAEFVCSNCNGTCKVTNSTRIEYFVKKGSGYGEYPIEGKGDFVRLDGGKEIRGHIILQIRPPTPDKMRFGHFKRINNDLVYEHTLTLNEALTGCDIHIKHMDSEENPFLLKCRKVIQPESSVEVPGKGMPVVDERGVVNDKFGKLIVIFHVSFPDSFPPDIKNLLNNVLHVMQPNSSAGGGGGASGGEPEVIELDNLVFSDMKAKYAARGQSEKHAFMFGEAGEDDDGEGEGPEGMGGAPQCAQQ